MRFWIDCEWNGYRGQLISMALVGEDGEEFYEVTHCYQPCEWVQQFVMPVLCKGPIDYDDMQKRLEVFLLHYDYVHIVADWPEDINRFCNLLITGPGQRIQYPKLSFEIVDIHCDSTMPHNALHDARAIREACMFKEAKYA